MLLVDPPYTVLRVRPVRAVVRLLILTWEISLQGVLRVTRTRVQRRISVNLPVLTGARHFHAAHHKETFKRNQPVAYNACH